MSSAAVSSPAASGRWLPAVQQGLVTGQLVQQRITGDRAVAISVEDFNEREYVRIQTAFKKTFL